MHQTIEEVEPDISWEAITKLDSDLKLASRQLGPREARWLVDIYYQVQAFRVRSKEQIRSAGDEPNAVLQWTHNTMRSVENNIKRSLGEFAAEYTVGQWLQSLVGIGPVISAGLLAGFDVRDRPTAGHFWRFCGLEPTVKWEKKSKRPWNAGLKVLVAFKLGECFVKFQNNRNDFYGGLFRQYKAEIAADNDAGKFATQCEEILSAKKFGKTTEAFKHYSAGRLPPAHVHARARRKAVKIFVSHLHHVMWSDFYGSDPVKPYIFVHGETPHSHYIAPPNWPGAFDGKCLTELYA